jgi:hypothetical protein
MLIIETKLKEAPGKGIGLFADENIKKGQTVWIENPLFYRIIPYYEFRRLPGIQKEFIKKHATEYPKEKIFYLDLDDTRFINHSPIPNIKWLPDSPIAVATKNIKKGEEILVNYLDLNPDQPLDFAVKKVKDKK